MQPTLATSAALLLEGYRRPSRGLLRTARSDSALPVIALAVRVDSHGPVLYRELRVGRYGRIFRICKSRFMVNGGDYVGLGRSVAKDDERIMAAQQPSRRAPSVDQRRAWRYEHRGTAASAPAPRGDLRGSRVQAS